MKYNFPKLTFLFSIIFLAFSCYAFYYFFSKLQENTVLTDEMNVELQKEVSTREEMKFLDTTIKSIKNEIVSLDKHFVQSSNVVPFLDMIEALALRAKAKAEVVLVDLPKNNPNLMVEVKAEGGFDSVYKFLNLLENSPYEIEFMSVDLQTPLSETPNKQQAKWSIFLKIKLLSFIK